MHTVFGIHAVNALLDSRPEAVDTLLLSKNRQDHLLTTLEERAKTLGIALRFVDKKELDTHGKSHQGAMALLNATTPQEELSLPELIERALAGQRLILALDGLTDPHNLGACLRSAEALGAAGVLIPRDRSAQVSSIVHKTSAGASERIPVISITNLSQSLKTLKDAGFWITGLAGEGDIPLSEVDFSLPTVLVLGSEGSGMRRLTKEHCDFIAKIPMKGTTESLNVSVACGVALYEVSRQRQSD
jgi:23S rRNA (guanosine2251-2'-O)-methyltransferase